MSEDLQTRGTATHDVSGHGFGVRLSQEKATSWAAIGSTYLPAFILALGTGIAVPAIPAIGKSFGVSFGVASMLVTGYLVGGLIGTVPSGWLVDRFGRRSVMLTGPLITAASGLLIAVAHTFPEALVYRFIGGFAAQMWLIARLDAISHLAAPSQRGRMVSWLFAMDNSGKLFGPLLGGLLAGGWGPRAPFTVYGCLALVALVPAALVRSESTRRPTGGSDGSAASGSGLSLGYIVRSRAAYFGVALFASLTRGPVQADLLLVYAAFAYHLAPQSVGYLATIGAAVYLPIGLCAGVMMDRFGRKRSMVPGFAGVGLAMIALSLSAFAHLSLSWFIGLYLIEMLTQAFTGGSIQTIGTDVAPAQARGLFLGLWRFTGQSGMTFGPIAFSALAQLAYGASFIFTASTAGIVTFLLVRYVPETHEENSAVLQRYRTDDSAEADRVTQLRRARSCSGRATDD